MRGLAVVSLSLLSLVVACPSGRVPPPPTDSSIDGGDGVTAGTCEVGAVTLVLPDDSASLQTGGAPDLSCVGAPRAVGAAQQATLEGCIDVFGIGNNAASGAIVSVFNLTDDPSTATPITTGVVAVRNQASTLDCAGVDSNAPACRAFECSSLGFYRTEGTVPTHTPLIFKIKHPSNANVIQTFIYGHVLFNDEIDDGVVNYEMAMIFKSTWDSIPTLGGRQITGGLDVTDGDGRGVIAGEIHDCNDVILQGAAVSIPSFDRGSMSIAYFNGDDEDPKPDLTKISTQSDGLYVVLNVPTTAGQNEHVVTAGIREPGCTGDDCTCQSAGSRTIRAFPDSVTIATLRGDFPVIQ